MSASSKGLSFAPPPSVKSDAAMCRKRVCSSTSSGTRALMRTVSVTFGMGGSSVSWPGRAGCGKTPLKADGVEPVLGHIALRDRLALSQVTLADGAEAHRGHESLDGRAPPVVERLPVVVPPRAVWPDGQEVATRRVAVVADGV